MVYCKRLKILIVFFIVLFIIFAPEFVFATSIEMQLNQQNSLTIDLPSWIETDNLYYFFFGFQNGNAYSCYCLVSVIPITITYDYNSSVHRLNGQFCTFKDGYFSGNSALSNIKNFYENLNRSSNPSSNTSYGVTKNHLSNATFYYCNHDILNASNNNVSFANTDISSLVAPEIITSSSDLSNLNFKNLEINLNDYQGQDVYLLTYDRSNVDTSSLQEGEDIDYNQMYTDMISDVLGLNQSENEQDLTKLYPRKEILLNSDSKYFKGDLVDDGSNYLIPIDELGINFKVNGTYGFRFAIREPIESEFSEWGYTYLGDIVSFNVISNKSGFSDSEIAQQVEEKKHQEERAEDKRLQQEQTNAIQNQTAQDGEFYNNILSNDYDENKAGDTFSGTTSSTDNIDDSQYTGLFSAIFGKFSNKINGNYNSVESIEYPMPNTDKKIVITSDLLSSKIQGTFINVILQSLWMFVFGMYIFKFSNNLIRKIKSGSILNGYENNDEVITSTML